MENNRTLLEQQIEDMDVFSFPRAYLGYSGLGGECKRAVLFDFRWAYKKTHKIRIQRIFDKGHREEGIIADELADFGYKVYDDQLEVKGLSGHSGGHIDGKVIGIPDCPDEELLFEAKTANSTRFNEFVKSYDPETNHKKLGLFFPEYVWQFNLYMGKLGLKKCLLVATNKDNEARLYFIIKFDKSIYDMARRCEVDILTANRLFDRIGNNSSAWYKCSFCNSKKICFGKEPVAKNCRTCKFADLEDGGKWSCSFHNNDDLSYKEQYSGCDDYKAAEMFSLLGGL